MSFRGYDLETACRYYVKSERMIYAANGPQIRNDRKNKGLTLREAAKRIGISPTFLSRVERNTDVPISAKTLEAIFYLYNTGTRP